MKIKIKKLHPDAIIPKYAKDDDAGLDLVAVSINTSETYLYEEYGTGLSIEIPKGYIGLIFPRSSISTKCHFLTNSVGVIDSGYRGEIKFRFKPDTASVFGYFLKGERPNNNYKVGDKIGQLIIMPYPQIELEEVQELSDSERGTNGFGSSGN